MPTRLTRSDFLKSLVLGATATGLHGQVRLPGPQEKRPGEAGGPKEAAGPITAQDLAAVEKVARLAFDADQRRAVLERVRRMSRDYEDLRAEALAYTVEPPAFFSPQGRTAVPWRGAGGEGDEDAPLKKPGSAEDLAFLPVHALARLVEERKVSPVELAEISLRRLERHGGELLCVVTLTRDLAMEQARRAEAEIRAGRYRGPLHGIPYGLKDLFATRGIPTTWGAAPRSDQVLDHDASVVEKLAEAGAVLVAKLSMGALARGDRWFRGRTRNPWNRDQGSSGSSAGSAAATAAGLVPFAIGTETLGSIMSPSLRCRVTGLRPTYGRVPRYGAMPVSWSMDKIGPICRNARDCALVLQALAAPDPRDPSAAGLPFTPPPPRADLSDLRIGYVVRRGRGRGREAEQGEREELALLRRLGLEPRPVELAAAGRELRMILSVEAAAAFDEFTRSGEVDRLRESAWPRAFRAARHVTAVEYLRAQRVRRRVQERFEAAMGDLHVVVDRGLGGPNLLTTNLTGHPQLIIPFGTTRGRPLALSLLGRLYGEAALLAVGARIQEATDHHLGRPELG